MKAIDGQEIIDACQYVIDHGIANSFGRHDISAEIILETIKNMPPIQPEQCTGEWIIKKDKNGTYGVCSECGMKQYAGKTRFCPDCGARMDGGKNG